MVKYLGRSETDAGVPETVIADQTLSMYIACILFRMNPEPDNYGPNNKIRKAILAKA